MNSEIFENRINLYKSILKKHIENELIWDNHWFQIEPLNENDSVIYINYQLEEIRVGIGMVTEYYSDKYKGMEYEKGFNKFLTLLFSKIKREDYFKGKFPYKSHYTFEKNGIYQLFGTSITWAFPFWKKSIKKESIQKPIIESKKVKKELCEIKHYTQHGI
ncbi:MAG: hypothetical protein L3J25_02890 [Flavobacteriaceae bacterium]|nr:hypothetical protein [Flavobacteriaceae bacterium]